MIKKFTAALCLMLSLAVANQASATIISQDLGNIGSGFVDGQTVGFFPDVFFAQQGQQAPFGSVSGHEYLQNFQAFWQFNFGAITSSITSASLSFGIWDHDSSATGDQVASFLLDGSDFTSTLNGLFNGKGGTDEEYNIYTVDLMSISNLLTDGILNVALDLQGSGLVTEFGTGIVSNTFFNGAGLIFSSLAIEYSDVAAPSPNPNPNATAVSEPPAMALLALGLLMFVRRKRSL